MGGCLSCLSARQERPRADSAETRRLLNDEQHQSHYGALHSHLDEYESELPDEEQLQRERDALERICTQTADKLIDVTQTSSHVRDGVKPAGPLERLFNATFRNESASRPVENERAWLQRLMSRDATDRSWDWNAVQEIDGHITFDFDGADQSSIANGKKPLRE